MAGYTSSSNNKTKTTPPHIIQTTLNLPLKTLSLLFYALYFLQWKRTDKEDSKVYLSILKNSKHRVNLRCYTDSKLKLWNTQIRVVQM